MRYARHRPIAVADGIEVPGRYQGPGFLLRGSRPLNALVFRLVSWGILGLYDEFRDLEHLGVVGRGKIMAL